MQAFPSVNYTCVSCTSPSGDSTYSGESASPLSNSAESTFSSSPSAQQHCAEHHKTPSEIFLKEVLSGSHTDILELESSLFYAAKKGAVHIIEELIKKNADITSPNFRDEALWHIAAECGQVNVLRFIVEKGIKILEANGSGDTCLHYAAQRNQVDAVNYLLEIKGDVATPNGNGETSIALAVRYDCLEVLKVFAQKGVNFQTICDSKGSHPIHLAAAYGKPNVLYFLQPLIIDINVRGPQGRIASHFAASQTRESTIQALYMLSADLNAKDDDGNTPGHLMVGNIAFLDLLYRMGCDFSILNNKQQRIEDLILPQDRESFMKAIAHIDGERNLSIARTMKELVGKAWPRKATQIIKDYLYNYRRTSVRHSVTHSPSVQMTYQANVQNSAAPTGCGGCIIS